MGSGDTNSNPRRGRLLEHTDAFEPPGRPFSSWHMLHSLHPREVTFVTRSSALCCLLVWMSLLCRRVRDGLWSSPHILAFVFEAETEWGHFKPTVHSTLISSANQISQLLVRWGPCLLGQGYYVSESLQPSFPVSS